VVMPWEVSTTMIKPFGDDNGRILALDASTGAHVWAKQTGFAVQASPVVVNGVVYIRSLDGYLYALDRQRAPRYGLGR
jgi:outer membrane protein assembly factor BamB